MNTVVSSWSNNTLQTVNLSPGIKCYNFLHLLYFIDPGILLMKSRLFIEGTCYEIFLEILTTFLCLLQYMFIAVTKVNNPCSSGESTPKVRPSGESNGQGPHLGNKIHPLRGKDLVVFLYSLKLIFLCLHACIMSLWNIVKKNVCTDSGV